MAMSLPGNVMSQSMGDSAMEAVPMRLVGMSWLSSISSAFLLQRSVVEMMMRWAKESLPPSVSKERPDFSKKESRWDFWR